MLTLTRSSFRHCAASGDKILTRSITPKSYRLFTTNEQPQVVDLDYNAAIPADGNANKGALVILHGLFGSKRNWGSLTKAFMRDLKRPVYALDLRNQGSSPHASPMTYTHMAADVLYFARQRSLSGITLLGHSMGGKVAMALALQTDLPEGLLSKLIVEDVAPARTEISASFKEYVKGMQAIEAASVKSRKEATEILEQYEKDPSIHQFLLTNLHVPSASSKEVAKFQIPLTLIGESIPEIGWFPYAPGERTWNGPTLFVKGSRSKYINRHNLPICKQFFPSMKLEELDTDHWVHSEKPNDFKEMVLRFMRESESA
ncbi:alpha/beta-hydrolase [Pluteus cervinus]|uniref:Alpha/beta-hydrolase n=1 Tax=Pluteus cervinus TaxID=181527 RepID=A0ACD3B5D7_9AGAR|nr:alpha/beta-hydrolase [Pluteus cervinus]